MAAWPTTPEPPVRFTTLKGWPRSRWSRLATMRTTASVPPPAAHGQSSCTGRAGQRGWASAGAPSGARLAPEQVRRVVLVMVLFLP
jgi:hypothetical protein